MFIESTGIEKEKKPDQNAKRIETGEEPIVDIEVNKATLELWEKRGLKDDILALVNDFETLVPEGEKFLFHPANFEYIGEFVDRAKYSFRKIGGKNLEEKIKEVENETSKAILNFAFNELKFDPKNPELIKQETINGGDEITLKYFKTNHPNLVLIYDSIDWWLGRKE